jgi:hypothetical protein
MDIDFYKIYSTTNEYEKKMKIYCEKEENPCIKKKNVYN